jgi:pantoate--beta-alanine ligase
MNVVERVDAMAALADEFRCRALRIGLVPTMGYLHAGHGSLMKESVSRCDVTVVSIFVNPVQFGPNEDFSRYPRDLERDCRLCRETGADVVFCPSAEEMYAPDRSVGVVEQTLSSGLCGASRPGHFSGVCTVVAKLFNIVRPAVAVFGQKDAQQLAVIRRMVRDLNYRLEIIGAPIVREADGLAMSSRNIYLSASEREQALGLNRVLLLAAQAVRDGQVDAGSLRVAMEDFLRRGYPGVDMEYITFADAETLALRESVVPGTLLAVAARVGRTRLIDNVLLM